MLCRVTKRPRGWWKQFEFLICKHWAFDVLGREFGVRNGRGVDSVDEVLIGNNWVSLPAFPLSMVL